MQADRRGVPEPNFRPRKASLAARQCLGIPFPCASGQGSAALWPAALVHKLHEPRARPFPPRLTYAADCCETWNRLIDQPCRHSGRSLQGDRYSCTGTSSAESVIASTGLTGPSSIWSSARLPHQMLATISKTTASAASTRAIFFRRWRASGVSLSGFGKAFLPSFRTYTFKDSSLRLFPPPRVWCLGSHSPGSSRPKCFGVSTYLARVLHQRSRCRSSCSL